VVDGSYDFYSGYQLHPVDSRANLSAWTIYLHALLSVMKKFAAGFLLTALFFLCLEGMARLYLSIQAKKITPCPETMEAFGDYKGFLEWEKQLDRAGQGLYYGTTDYSSTTGLWNKPNFSKKFKNIDLSFNSLGFRGKEFPLQKPKNVYRIFLVGASTVQGAANDNWTISHYLQNELDPSGEKIQVINAGVVGITANNELDLIVNKLLKMQPDLIITIDGSLDLYNSNFPRLSVSNKLQQILDGLVNAPRFSTLAAFSIRSLIRKSQFFKVLFQRLQEASAAKPAANRVTLSKEAVHEYVEHLKNVKAILEANNATGLLIFQPALGAGKKSLSLYEQSVITYQDEIDRSNWVDEVRRVWPLVGHEVSSLPRNHHVGAYDFSQLFLNEKGSTYSDTQHYSPLGDKLIAKGLEILIRKELKKK